MKAILFATLAVLGTLPVAAVASPAATLAQGIAAYEAGQVATAQAAFRTLADQGSAIGETMLGVMYSRGQGVGADPATAAAYWLRAANRGYPPAQLALAQALAAGRGVARDPGGAWVWANLAARTGDSTTVQAAGRLAAALQPGFSHAEQVSLDRQLAGWRPWAAREQ